MDEIKSHKKIVLPKGLKQAVIVPRTKDHPMHGATHDELLEEDFDKDRINYRLIYIYGVPIYVKVEPK